MANQLIGPVWENFSSCLPISFFGSSTNFFPSKMYPCMLRRVELYFSIRAFCGCREEGGREVGGRERGGREGRGGGHASPCALVSMF